MHVTIVGMFLLEIFRHAHLFFHDLSTRCSRWLGERYDHAAVKCAALDLKEEEHKSHFQNILKRPELI